MVSPLLNAVLFDAIRFNANGLVAAIAQDVRTNEVVMMAWMNAQALSLTLETRQAVFWSRSRGALWKKGEVSGNVLNVHEVCLDCDGDALLLKVELSDGVACHTGRYSCFYQKFDWATQQWQDALPILKNAQVMYAALNAKNTK